ncbi:MAG: c-type cytochrome [Pseudohongiellaceae bacterium]|nr:cytochrome c [Pseudomonadales bacterium]
MIKGFTFLALLFALVTHSVFAASPRINYLLYCSGCHRPLGEGNPPNVPTLHNELGLMMSVQEMRGYLARVPGSAHAPITDAELTDVLNWMLEQFNADTLPEDFKKLTVEEVTKAREESLADPNQYRADFWKPYDFSKFKK